MVARRARLWHHCRARKAHYPQGGPDQRSSATWSDRTAHYRPWARSGGGAEVRLDTSAAFADEDLLGQVVRERMLAGVTARRHPVGQPAGWDVARSGESEEVA